MPSLEHLFDEVNSRSEEPQVGSSMSASGTSRALLRLVNAAATAGSSALPLQLAELFLELTHARAAVAYLRDGDQLVARGTMGPTLSSPSPSIHIAGLPSGPHEHELAWTHSAYPDPCGCGPGSRTTWVPLVHADQLVGAIFLGWGAELDAPRYDSAALAALIAPAAAVVAHHLQVEELHQAIRSRDDVLSVVAHDLQNPINVISLAANSLLQRLPDASSRRSIDRIVRGAQRASRMVRDLQEVSAIETGRFTIERQRLDPTDLILAAVQSQQSLAADASIIIASDVSPDLPPLEADEERLLEVLENLIGNALKFTAAGGSITVGAAHTGNALQVSVRDNGAGISALELPHIFDRFWQAKKKSRRGAGLGLTICKAIIEAHGGQIWAESEPGVGTSVFFTLPAPGERSAEPSTDVASILLVDDRPANLIALEAILERPDYRLVKAASGEEALRLALRERFAVALVDIAMPGMDGFEVAIRLKEIERTRDIPIIFLTAFGDDPEEIHRAYSAGGADYLVKPLDVEIVRKKVAVFVDLSRRRRRTPPPGA